MKRQQCKLCDRTDKTHHISQAGLCTACDASLHYWRKKTPAQMMKRAHQVDSFKARMDILLGNIQTMPRRKPRKTA